MEHKVDDIEARRDRIAGHVRAILGELGEDPSRDGLRETPLRVAKALLHLTRGSGVTPDRIPIAPFGPTPETSISIKKQFFSLSEANPNSSIASSRT